MRLNDSATYLALIRSALEKSILPELQSPAAKSAADLVGKVLNELSRREDGLRGQLATVNAEGAAIVSAMRAALQKKGKAVEKSIVATAGGDCTTAFAEFEALCAEMAAMAEALAGADTPLVHRAAEWEGKSHAAFIALPVPLPQQESEADPLPKPALEAFLRSVHPAGDKLRVTKLERMPGGFGKQTYMTEIDVGAAKCEPLVIRKSDRTPLLTHPSADLEREFHLLDALTKAGYPAPKPLWHAREVAGVDAEFMVMEKMPGRVAGSFFGGPDGGELTERLALHMAESLARLHGIELEKFDAVIRRFDDPAVLTDTIEQYARRTMASWRSHADSIEREPSPLFGHLMTWLENQPPQDSRRPVLLHGDFGIHNVLADNQQVTGVLDWEGALFGAPEMDLAFLQSTLSGYFDWDRFLQHYIDCGGRAPVPEAMNYSMAFFAMRNLLCCGKVARKLRNGSFRDLRFVMFELGFVPHFMEQALTYTSGD